MSETNLPASTEASTERSTPRPRATRTPASFGIGLGVFGLFIGMTMGLNQTEGGTSSILGGLVALIGAAFLTASTFSRSGEVDRGAVGTGLGALSGGAIVGVLLGIGLRLGLSAQLSPAPAPPAGAIDAGPTEVATDAGVSSAPRDPEPGAVPDTTFGLHTAPSTDCSTMRGALIPPTAGVPDGVCDVLAIYRAGCAREAPFCEGSTEPLLCRERLRTIMFLRGCSEN